MCLCVCGFVSLLFVCAIFMRRHFIGPSFITYTQRAPPVASQRGSLAACSLIHLFVAFHFYFILLFFTVCCTLRCLSDCQCCRRRRLVSLSSFLLVFPATPIPSALSLSLCFPLCPCVRYCVCVCVPLSVCIQNLLIPRTHTCFKVQIPYVAPSPAAFFTHRT